MAFAGLAILVVCVVGGCSPRDYLESASSAEDVDAAASIDTGMDADVSSASDAVTGEGIRGSDAIGGSIDAPVTQRSVADVSESSGLPSVDESTMSDMGSADSVMRELFGGDTVDGDPAPPVRKRGVGFESADRSETGDTDNPDAFRLRTPSRPIPTNASPDKLIESLGDLDADVRTMVAGGDPERSPEQNRELLLAFLETKWDVADALVVHPESEADQVTLGKRAAIEAMSGLASLGMESAVGSLREASEEAIGSSRPGLKIDGHLVQLAMASRRFIAGQKDGAASMMEHVDAIAETLRKAGGAVAVQTPGEATSTLVGLGRARQTLSKYGEDLPAAKIRDNILDLYADSPSPSIAMLAAEMAGQMVFDEVDELLERLIAGENVEAERWTTAIEDLIDEAPDLLTVRYLAPAALELEAAGLRQAADRIYDVMQRRFDDPDSATAREVQLAVEAMSARREMIGKMFTPSGSDLRDRPLTLLDHRGKIVLMPFWASDRPESLSILDSLRDIRERHPDRVAIVGMNLDLSGPMTDELAQAMDDIASFRGAAPSEPINPVAKQFGLVSLPFVVVVDQDGLVSHIAYLPAQIRRATERLLDESDD